MKFAAIADWAASNDYPVAFMCEQLGVSRSGYYAWRGAEPSTRAGADDHLTALITAIWHRARGNPGVRRIHAALTAAGHRLSRKRVWRLMRAAGLRGRHPKAWKCTTVHGEQPVPAPDLIGRSFTANQPNQKWCGDIKCRRRHLISYADLRTMPTVSCDGAASGLGGRHSHRDVSQARMSGSGW